MIDICNLLKETRLEKGLTLAQVSTDIKISVTYLENLENYDLDSLPSKTHIRGFVNSYSRYLKLDSKKILENFNSSMGTTRPVPQIQRMEKNLWKTVPFIGKFKPNALSLSIILLVAIIGSLLGGKNIVDKYMSESEPQSTLAVEPTRSASHLIKSETDLILESFKETYSSKPKKETNK